MVKGIKLKKHVITISIILSILMAQADASPAGIKLSKVQNMASFSTQVLDYVAKKGMKDATVFTSQSFVLSINNKYVGTLLTGEGMYPNEEGGDKSTCFVALVKKTGQIDFLPTVGAEEWEVPSCLKVIAVGTIQAKNDKDVQRLAILHHATTRNSGVYVESVILMWKDALNKLEYDIDSYWKASNAGADTISKVRALFK